MVFPIIMLQKIVKNIIPNPPKKLIPMNLNIIKTAIPNYMGSRPTAAKYKVDPYNFEASTYNNVRTSPIECFLLLKNEIFIDLFKISKPTAATVPNPI